MRIVGEYLAKAAAFQALSAAAYDSDAKKHYAEQARYYNNLARERHWMLAIRSLKTETSAAAVV